MQAMTSSHFAEPLRAREYSSDGLAWNRIPDTISVLGSRFALVIKDLREEEHVLPLNQTRVAVGNSRGKLGSRYIQGRVDKACLDVLEQAELPNEGLAVVRINLVAELAEPFAVFLRDHG
jgi:hypothetical protein